MHAAAANAPLIFMNLFESVSNSGEYAIFGSFRHRCCGEVMFRPAQIVGHAVQFAK
jgi:hypothetical protein